MPPTRLLPDALLRELHDAAVSANLDRNTLLATLDRRLTAGFHKAPNRAAQLWQDLSTLNEIPALLDGSVPLRTWLETARDHTAPRPESAVFHRALESLGARLGFPVAPISPPAPAPPAPTPHTPSTTPSTPTTPPTTVVLLTALKEEYDAARQVDTGADTPWTLDTATTGFEIAFRTYRTLAGAPLRVALTWAPRMRTTSTADTASRLFDALHPACLAMTGVCAGRRGKVEPGDVVIASLLYTYDTGSLRIEYDPTGAKHERFQAEPNPYPLDERWLHRAQAFHPPPDAPWLTARPPTLAAQCDWVLARLIADEDPLKHPDSARRCPSWGPVLARLRSLALVTPRGAPKLTPEGIDHIEEVLLRHRDSLPAPPPFSVHVAPLATGNHVMRDPLLFDRLSDSMRTVLAVDMESAAIAAIAHARKLPWLVMKGVMDHADHDKDDELKPFATRASAECLLAFLRENPPPP